MTAKRAGWIVLMIIAGAFSTGVSAYGARAVIVIDYRFSTLLSLLYCVFPVLSLPVLLVVLVFRRLAALQAIFVVAWLPVYTALTWRNCRSVGICDSVVSTFMVVLTTHVVLAYIASAVCVLAANSLREQKASRA
jgi:hypothetical protein